MKVTAIFRSMPLTPRRCRGTGIALDCDMWRRLVVVAIFTSIGCSDARSASIMGDGASSFTAPSGQDSPVAHAAPTPLANVRVLLPGEGVLDASADRGGGIWAVTANRVFYFAPG